MRRYRSYRPRRRITRRRSYRGRRMFGVSRNRYRRRLGFRS